VGGVETEEKVLTQWEKVKAAHRMQDYIESHIDQPISMSDLAKAAYYSQWHAARVFKEVTGKTPFDYIRRRRLALAAQRLGKAETRVVDVAMDFVFDSHEGFTRAFAREFGITPTRFRRDRPAISLFMPPRLRDWYYARQHGETSMSEKSKPIPVFVQVLERPSRRMVVRRGVQASHYFEYCEEVGCDVWEQLGSIKAALGEPMGMWLPERFRRPGTSTYVQGVEVPADLDLELPAHFELLELPPCTMLVFQGPPFEDKDFEAAIATVWDIINSYQPELYGYQWADDDGPRFQLQPVGYRGYIEGRPVRKLG